MVVPCLPWSSLATYEQISSINHIQIVVWFFFPLLLFNLKMPQSCYCVPLHLIKKKNNNKEKNPGISPDLLVNWLTKYQKQRCSRHHVLSPWHQSCSQQQHLNSFSRASAGQLLLKSFIKMIYYLGGQVRPLGFTTFCSRKMHYTLSMLTLYIQLCTHSPLPMDHN